MTVLENQVGVVRPTDIINEMQEAYLDYAMSVIVSRALPDVRDGLKPVHRRILYAMSHDLGLDHSKPHRKSARIVGEVLGKYHPHGDVAVYDAMVRMAQEFSLRYPLVDGQGNFGSVDGDNAAAMRYTEARLAEISGQLLTDLEKDTVDWHDNFDNSLREPNILPAALPNLLINGSSGIAVGMSTNVPPHNLREIVDALAFMIDNFDQTESITVEHLMQFVKGPDFPTGGIIYRYREDKADESLDVIAQGYSVGRGRLIVQAKAHFEEMSRNRSRIVITELPYQTNKTNLLERIAALVRDGKLDGITDLRDESDRTGMRIVIELTRNVEPKNVLADLFKQTPLQQTFGMQMLALVDGEPRTLSLKRILQLFIEHRQEIVRRRSEFELGRARERAHIVEGLLKALDMLDEVIATIRRSRSAETARNNLMRDFDFSQVQAQAILDMQLRRLAAMERTKLKDEYKELQERIAYLEKLLADPAMVLALIKEDLLELREKYGDARRTQIVDRTRGTLTSTDLLPQQDVWVSVGANGSLRRQEAISLTAAALRQIGKNSEVALLRANTRDYLYLFNSSGQCRRMSIHELPYNGSDTHVSEVTDFSRRDVVTAALALPRLDSSQAQGYLFMVTALGAVKRVTMADFLAAAAGDPVVMNVDSKDRLIQVLHTQGDQEVLLVSSSGQSIRFKEEDVRSMGLPAGGVGGMKLGKGDRVIYAAVVDPEGDLLTITEAGFAKRTQLSQYSSQGRYGSGIVTHKPNKRTGSLAAALLIENGATDALVVLPSRGAVKVVGLEEIPQMGRSVQGKSVVDLSGSASVVDIKQVMQPPDIVVEVEEEAAPAVTLPMLPTNGADVSNGHAANLENGSANPSEDGQSKSSKAKSEEKVADTTNGDGGKSSDGGGQAKARTSTRKQGTSTRKKADANGDGANGSGASSDGNSSKAKQSASNRSSRRRGTEPAKQTTTSKSRSAQNGAEESKEKGASKQSSSRSRRSSTRRSSTARDRSDAGASATDSAKASSSGANAKSTSRRKRSTTGSSDTTSSNDAAGSKPRARRRTKQTSAASQDKGAGAEAKAKTARKPRTRKRTASAKQEEAAPAAQSMQSKAATKPKSAAAKPAPRARGKGKLSTVTSVKTQQAKKRRK